MSKKKPEKKTEASEDNQDGGLAPQAKAIIFFGAAALLFALVLYPGENVWTMAYMFFRGIFGCLAFLFPCAITYVGVMTALEKEISGKTINKLVLSVVAVVLFAACIFLFGNGGMHIHESFFECLLRLYKSAKTDFAQGSGAGVLGGLIGYPIAFLFGFTASELLCILLMTVDLMFLFGVTAKDVIFVFGKPVDALKKSLKQADFNAGMGENNILKTVKNRVKKIKSDNKRKKEKPVIAEKKEDYGDNYLQSEVSSQVTSIMKKNRAATERNSENTRSVHYSEDRNISSDTGEGKRAYDEKAAYGKSDILDKLVYPESDNTGKKKKKLTKKQELAQAEEEISRQISESESSGINYNYPPVELLYPSESREDAQKAMEELERTSVKLDSTLKSFGVNAGIVNICRGPSVTRFEVKPAPGVKISKITNLADDIALNLAASGVRIEAPIPGKAAVGIEIPNKVVTMVSMRELIDSNKFRSARSKLSVVLGKDISGNIIVTDLAKMPHLLIAGTTGSGKSVCVNSILISLLYKAAPEEVKMLLIDPKMVEFSKYKGIPHLLIPVVTDPKKAAGALNWAVNEMEERYRNFALFGVRDIAGYNKMVNHYNKIRREKTPEELEQSPIVNSEGIPVPEERMPSIIIAIDEFADLMMTAPNEVEDSICRLAQKARAAGMHLIVATQRPTVNVITGVIKANIPSRIALKVSSQLDSRTILDVGGAEKLIGKGDMLFAPIGIAKPVRVQGCFASDMEIENVTEYVKKEHSFDYDMEIEEEIEKITEQGIGKDKNSNSDISSESYSTDDMMEEAIKLVVENGQASTSLLQRRLRLGYARAGRLIDEMEQMGIVGPHVGSKSREVLMTYQEWLERKNNTDA